MKPIKICLNRTEVNALKEFCDNNSEYAVVEISQDHYSGIGYTTVVQAKGVPETETDITDLSIW